MNRTWNSQPTADEAKASLADVFSDGPFRFRLGTRPGDAGGFFSPTEANREILAERRRWLQSDQARHAILRPDGASVLDAAIDELLTPSQQGALSIVATPYEKLIALGAVLEPDLVFLQRDSAGRMVVVGGCVCFPTNWRLTDKLGQPVGMVHDVVPGLNSAIGPAIDNFLARMKPGCWERSNWGMSRSAERNQHPQVHPSGFPTDCTIGEVWLRIEDQALVPLPEVAGVVFGIRVRHVALGEILQCPAAAERLLTAIETMPADMLRYKNLTAIRERLIHWLRSALDPRPLAGG